MPKKLKLAVSQARTLPTRKETLASLESIVYQARQQGADLILFPEAFLGGYPRHCSFGAAVGSRSDHGREQFLQYYQSAIDLGDTPRGAGDDWIARKLPVAKGEEHRGDGTREDLERVARESGVFLVVGLVERSGGSLYCGVVYVCPQLGVIGKRRKIMPTGSERLVWAQGSPSTLRAVTTRIKGVKLTMAAAICWENLMPLARYALYSQNVNLWLAPTADARDSWLSLMRTVGNEGRCFVLSAISCVKRKNLPAWITADTPAQSVTTKPERVPSPTVSQHQTTSGRRRSTITVKEERHELILPCLNGVSAVEESVEDDSPAPKQETYAATATDRSGEEFACRGGSCITGPQGQVIAEPLWEVEDGGLLIQEVDFEDCERARLDLDVAGSYSRNDAFTLTVEGLDITPPP